MKMTNVITVEKIQSVDEGIDHVAKFLRGYAGRRTKAIIFTSNKATKSDVFVRLLIELPYWNVDSCTYVDPENQPFEDAECAEIDFNSNKVIMNFNSF